MPQMVTQQLEHQDLQLDVDLAQRHLGGFLEVKGRRCAHALRDGAGCETLERPMREDHLVPVGEDCRQALLARLFAPRT